MHVATRKGFTMIELLLVVVIVGLLASFAVPKFANTKQRAVRAAGISDLHTLLVAQERFYSETGRYGALADSASLKVSISRGNGPLAITPSGAPAGSSGYSAALTIPGGSCGIVVGAAAKPAGMPSDTPASTPVCW